MSFKVAPLAAVTLEHDLSVDGVDGVSPPDVIYVHSVAPVLSS